MEKYVNIKYNLIIGLILGLLFSIKTYSQESIQKLDYANPQEYIIGGVSISGVDNLSKTTLIQISELEIGNPITIPGDKIKKAIKKLWDQGLFSNISINIIDIVDNNIFLNILIMMV